MWDFFAAFFSNKFFISRTYFESGSKSVTWTILYLSLTRFFLWFQFFFRGEKHWRFVVSQQTLMYRHGENNSAQITIGLKNGCRKGVYISPVARVNSLCDCRMTISRHLGATGLVRQNRWNNALRQNAGWRSILSLVYFYSFVYS